MAGRKEYEMLFRLSAELGSSYSGAFNNAKNPVMGLQTQINKLNKAQADISAYQKQQGAVDQTRKRLEMLKQQYDNIQKEMAETGDSSAAMKNQLIAKQNQIDRTSASLQQQTDKLNGMEKSLKNAGISTKNLASESRRLDSEIDELKNSQEQAAQATTEMDTSLSKAVVTLNGMMAALGVTALLKQFYDGLKASAEAAISFESAMAGVDKTTNLSSAELAAMADEFQRMSTTMPMSANELAGIAETAGQLGIAKQNITDFTEVMAMLLTATTMTAQEGATMLAQFANITQMDPSNYERLASATVDLGNNFATTEQKIIDMSQGMAASATLAGMSEPDILGLSAAISSLGIEAQAGSTSASKLITELDKAIKTRKGLSDFARVAGMSANDFSKAWGENAAGALALFITGLNDTERNGKSATVILEELGITEVRLQRMMLSLAGSGDLMNRAITTSNRAWRKNTALQDEANRRYGTTESKIAMAKNSFENLKVTLGEHLTPIIGAVAEKITSVVTGITNWMDKNPELTQAILTMGGILLLGMGSITAYTAVVNIGTAALAAFKLAIPGIGWVMGGIAALALLGGAFVLLKNHIDNNRKSFGKLDEQFDALMGTINEQNVTLDLIDEYRQLKAEIDGGKLSTEELAANQERLAEVKSLLVQRSDGLITATDNETEAFDRQVAALKGLAEAKIDDIRKEAYENITKQSGRYVQALRDEIKYRGLLNAAEMEQASVETIMASKEASLQRLLEIEKEISAAQQRKDDYLFSAEGAAWNQKVLREAEQLVRVLTGDDMSWAFSQNNAMFQNYIQGIEVSSKAMEEAHQKAREEVEKYKAALNDSTDIQSRYLDNLVTIATEGGMTMEHLQGILSEEFNGFENRGQIVADIMDEIRARTEMSAESTSELGNNMEDAAAQALAIEQAAQETKTKIDELAKAYDKAYDSAYSSISGQLKLFQDLKKLDKKDVKSTDQMLQSLQDQAAYLDTYNANLQKAKEMGVAKELVAQLSDGSVESAQHLQTIVSSSAEKVTEINEAFAKVNEGKEAFASTVAEMQTDFASKMSALQQELVSKVDEMNLYADAAESGRQTIQGLIQGAEGMKPAVAAAYTRVAQAAIDAINTKMKIHSPSKVMEEASTYSMQGLIIGTEKNQERYVNAMRETAQAGIEAYQDLELVRALGPMAFEENGKIFLRTDQPETIVSDAPSSRDSVFNLEISPVYNITGNSSPETVREALADHADSLRRLVMEIVDEAAIDQRRRCYDG